MGWGRVFAHVLACGWVAWGCASAPSGPTTGPAEAPRGAVAKEHLPPGALVDARRGFALLPIEGWELLGPPRVQALSNDAAAGAMAGLRPVRMGLVVVEPMRGVSLEEFAELVPEAVGWRDVRTTHRREIRYLGVPAIRMVLKGTMEGTPQRAEYVVFIHRGVGYQLVGSRGRGDAPSDELAPFFGAFRLLEGPVDLQEARPRVDRAQGAGWRIHDGTYRNVVSGLEVRLPEPWRFAVGAEREDVNPDAEVVFHHHDHNLTGLVISEPVPVNRRDTFNRAVSDSVEAAPVEGRAPVSFPWGGEPMDLRVFEKSGIELLHGIRCHGPTCSQLLLLYPRGHRDAVLPLLDADPPRIRHMPEALRRRLAKSASWSSAVSQVTEHEVYRARRYRNFRLGMELRLPPGDLWQVHIGDAAREHVEGALVYLEEPRVGIHGIILREENVEEDPKVHHQLVRAAIGLPEGGAIRQVGLGEAGGLESSGVSHSDIGPMRFRVVTTVIDTGGVRLVLWAWPSIMKARARTVDRLVRGLRFHGSPLPATRQDGQRFIDHRLGFAYRPPAKGWSRRDATPAHQRPFSSMHIWSRGDAHVLVLAVEPPGVDRDPEALRSLILSLLGRHLGTEVQDGAKTAAQARVAGRPAEHRTYREPGEPPSHFFIFARGSTVFGIIARGASPQRVIAGFELLE